MLGIERGIAVYAGALALLAGGGTACGGDDGDGPRADRTAPVLGKGLPPEVTHPAAAAIDDLQRAFVAGDYEGVCAGMTRGAARQAGEAGHGHPTSCVRDVRRLFAMIRKGGGWRYAGKPRVVALDVDRSKTTATATVALDRRWQAKVPVTRSAGRWRLSGFFGTTTPRGRQLAKAIPDTEFPPAGEQPLEIADASGQLCPDLADGDFPTVGGGCRIAFSGRVAPVGMLTALGYFKFEDCTVDYRFRTDSSGRTWIEDFEVEGVKVACGDVSPCSMPVSQEAAPWRGRLYADGEDRFLHRTNMCLWTCVGTFVGELTVRLIRDADGWRAEPVDGGGNSGFRFHQPMAVKGGFDIEVGGRQAASDERL